MSKVPPGLLYLTIYNPTLKASGPIVGDHEDAEEQAQILFYTGRETAVSRDKILRQVGLAKALVNFSGMFSSSDVCENTHSQSRRMIMVSPEPNYWIHACLELAKSPRPAPPKPKGKAAGKSPTAQQVVYDHHDGSIHDLALRMRVLRGYEQFKLTHGSFTSILSSLGQQALELQLERFFTVWAWKWDLDDDMHFGDHLGAPLHPLHRTQTPLLDAFSHEHLESFATFVLIPPYAVPSTSFTSAGCPSVLISHILSRIPPPPPPTPQGPPAAGSSAEKRPEDLPVVAPSPKKSLNQTIRASGQFLTVDMQNLKWMWTGLTFSKPSSAKTTAPPTPAILPPEHSTSLQPTPSDTLPEEQKPGASLSVPERADVEIDAESLQEAMTSDGWASNLPSPSLPETIPLPPSPLDDCTKSLPDETTNEPPQNVTPRVSHDASLAQRIEQKYAGPESLPAPEAPVEVEEPRAPVPEFLTTPIHLARHEDPLQTSRHRVYHATRGQLTFCVIVPDGDTLDLPAIAEQISTLFTDLEATMHEDANPSDDMATPVARLLEPQTKHIISSGQFTSSSRVSFTTESDNLYNGRQMLHSGFDIHEVFSRGQNPQHWHISRRGLYQSSESVPGEVFMEVARKESTLTDVDNELAGVVRRFLE